MNAPLTSVIWPAIAIFLLLVLAPDGAIAEVCDKVRPAWRPSYGRVGPFQEFVWFVLSPPGLVLAGLVGAAIWTGWRWLYAVGGGLTLAMAALLAIDWIDTTAIDVIREDAIREGCVYPPWITVGILTAFTLFAVWRVLRRRARRS